jgi:ribosome maturation factor RimP
VIVGQLSEEQVKDAPKGIKGEKKFRGTLVEVNVDNFVIVVNNFKLKLNYPQVKKINLDPDLKSAADKGE